VGRGEALGGRARIWGGYSLLTHSTASGLAMTCGSFSGKSAINPRSERNGPAWKPLILNELRCGAGAGVSIGVCFA
jgi:hypothetical protein